VRFETAYRHEYIGKVYGSQEMTVEILSTVRVSRPHAQPLRYLSALNIPGDSGKTGRVSPDPKGNKSYLPLVNLLERSGWVTELILSM